MTTDDEQAQDGQTTAQRNANLARVRDNQRRSRARRKEYLQELETKYRHCQQVGAEASSEIQTAARKVAGENKRLRLLLKQQGVSDAEIDGMPGDSQENGQPADALESMIGRRKSCGPGNDCGPASDCGSGPSTDRRSSCDPNYPTQSPYGQQSQQQRRADPQLQRLSQQMALPSLPFASPHSSVSSGIPTPSNASFANSQALPYGDATASHIPLQTLDFAMQYDEPFIWDTHYPTTQSDIGNSSSCYAATSAIRSIKPDIGYELETELGCGDGRECDVPNTQIFTIMDRYAE
ncbi:hypothetical protein LTR08_009083 [Meristemomyces frigidus]|nr:hypothetical protein LTR08_009083 [Meristemomyces frigidus]